MPFRALQARENARTTDAGWRGTLLKSARAFVDKLKLVPLPLPTPAAPAPRARSARLQRPSRPAPPPTYEVAVPDHGRLPIASSDALAGPHTLKPDPATSGTEDRRTWLGSGPQKSVMDVRAEVEEEDELEDELGHHPQTTSLPIGGTRRIRIHSSRRRNRSGTTTSLTRCRVGSESRNRKRELAVAKKSLPVLTGRMA